MLHALGAIIVVNEYLLLPPWHAQCIYKSLPKALRYKSRSSVAAGVAMPLTGSG